METNIEKEKNNKEMKIKKKNKISASKARKGKKLFPRQDFPRPPASVLRTFPFAGKHAGTCYLSFLLIFL